jgi:replication factor C subunit 3/5
MSIPKNLSNFIINKKNAEFLNSFSEDTLPHIIISGTHNSGKKVLCNGLLNKFYGENHEKKKLGTYELKIGNNTVDLKYMYNSYYYDINLYEYGLYDKNIITDFITDLVNYKPINDHKRIIILNHFDKISVDAQCNMRCLLERKANNFIFILIINNISKLDKSLLSRFLILNVSYPTEDEIKEYIYSNLKNEPPKKRSSIAKILMTQSDNNIYKINIYLDLYKEYNSIPINEKKNNYLDNLYKLIEKKNLESIIDARVILYNLVLLNIPLIDVFKEIIKHYTSDTDLIKNEYKIDFIHFCSNLQSKMCKIEHDIIALEYLILKIKKIII